MNIPLWIYTTRNEYLAVPDSLEKLVQLLTENDINQINFPLLVSNHSKEISREDAGESAIQDMKLYKENFYDLMHTLAMRDYLLELQEFWTKQHTIDYYYTILKDTGKSLSEVLYAPHTSLPSKSLMDYAKAKSVTGRIPLQINHFTNQKRRESRKTYEFPPAYKKLPKDVRQDFFKSIKKYYRAIVDVLKNTEIQDVYIVNKPHIVPLAWRVSHCFGQIAHSLFPIFTKDLEASAGPSIPKKDTI